MKEYLIRAKYLPPSVNRLSIPDNRLSPLSSSHITKAPSQIEMSFEFACPTCGRIYRGSPKFTAESAPVSYFLIPRAQRESRCRANDVNCIIDKKSYFIRGALELSVAGLNDPFSWGVWVAISEASHTRWKKALNTFGRSSEALMPGWLNSWLPLYPQTLNLRVLVHLRDGPAEPFVELAPTDHPLAIEQRNGITQARAIELYDKTVHSTRVC